MTNKPILKKFHLAVSELSKRADSINQDIDQIRSGAISIDQKVSVIKAYYKDKDYSYDELLNIAACSSIWANETDEAYDTVNEICSFLEDSLDVLREALPELIDQHKLDINNLSDIPAQALIQVLNKGKKMERSRRASAAANARHSMPGGSRDLKDKIRAIWATGKYSSRDICAEQECAGLGMSFSTARKALRNSPEPKKT